MSIPDNLSKINVISHRITEIFQKKNQLTILHSLSDCVELKAKETTDPYLRKRLEETTLLVIREMKDSPQAGDFMEGVKSFVEDMMKDELKTESDFEPFNKKIQILHSMFVFSGTNFFRSGKVKFVYTAQGSPDVKYTPRPGKGLFGKIQTFMHKRELQKEVRQVDLIKEALGAKKNENIVVDYEEVKEKERVGGQYTVQTKMASGDIEGPLANKEIKFPKSLTFAAGVLNGIAGLHKIGYVHGDLKLENVLYFPNETSEGSQVKIADFGKTTLLQSRKGIYKGNPRYAPPEGRLSQKGEVYSSAICMIRILESQFLNTNQDPLVGIESSRDSSEKAKSRKGVERFLVQDPRCLQTEESGWKPKIRVLVGRVTSMVSPPSQEKRDEAEIAIHQYIGELTKKMVHSPGRTISLAQVKELQKLLNDMTKANPDERPSAMEANQRMEDILKVPVIDINLNS